MASVALADGVNAVTRQTEVYIEDEGKELVEYVEPASVEEHVRVVSAEDDAQISLLDNGSVNVSWSISSGTLKKGTSFRAEKGQSVIIGLGISPKDKKIKVGLIQPDGTYRYVISDNAIAHVFEINQSSYYCFFVKNDNNLTVRVEGSYALLGGILLVQIYAVIVGVAELGITYNPFLRDVVEYYTNTESYKVSYNASIRWGRHILCDSLDYVAWRLLGCVQFFGMGVLYGAISGVIAFMTSNRVLVYAAPVLILGLWEKWLYAVILLFQKNEMVTETLRYFFIKPYVGSFGYLILYGFLVFLIVLVLCIAKVLEPKIMERYREGGSER